MHIRMNVEQRQHFWPCTFRPLDHNYARKGGDELNIKDERPGVNECVNYIDLIPLDLMIFILCTAFHANLHNGEKMVAIKSILLWFASNDVNLML